MRDDLLSILRGQKDLTHVFVCTFNIDFVFIESVLLRELRRCGHPTLTILADADEVQASFKAQNRWLSRLGRRYRVVPIRMDRGFRFHPKAVLTAGPTHCELLVGSGNLTFGGIRQNEEIWLHFASQNDESSVIASFRDYVGHCLTRTKRSDAARAELGDAFNAATHEWAGALDDPAGLLRSPLNEDSLLDQMAREVGELDVQRIIVASPYFDTEGVALQAIASRWPDAEVEMLVQAEQSQLHAKAWNAIREPKRLMQIKSSREGDSRPFIHAKFYAFVGANEAVVFAGSANCSRAALLIPGERGNAELLAVTRLSPTALQDQLFAGIDASSEPPSLPLSPPETPPSATESPFRIHSASYEHGVLSVAIDAPASATVSEFTIDESPVPLGDIDISPEHLRVRWHGPLHRVRITVAGTDGMPLGVVEHWIDHEFLLGATSRQRQMAQALSDNVAPGQWTFQGWTEVMRLLGDNLRYTPRSTPTSPGDKAPAPTSTQTVDTSQFVTDNYRLPGHYRESSPMDEAARVVGLRGLLLEYFGVDYDGDEAESPSTEEESGEDEVDRPETASRSNEPSEKPKRKAATSRSLSDAEKRRGRRIALKIIDTCTAPEFIETRLPSMLGSDLAIASVLLVSGHAESWLTAEDFVDFTYRLWSVLFFDDEADNDAKGATVGALERRFSNCTDPIRFAEDMRSPRLAAALATWSFSCPSNVERPEVARFRLATRLAVARMPWLWCLDDLTGVEKELFAIADRTAWLGVMTEQRHRDLAESWNTMLKEGLALSRLESVLLRQDLAALRATVKQDQVEAGSLLWQGPKLGFCVLGAAASRSRTNAAAVPVYSLRKTNRDLRIAPSYLLPFEALLSHAAQSSPEQLRADDAEALAIFMAAIRST